MTLSSLFFSEYRAATYLLALAVGWLVAYLLTPTVRQGALRLGFVDKPGGRKKQVHAVSLGGGVAVFGGALAAIIVAFLFADATLTKAFFPGDLRFLLGLGAAAAATMCLGLYDDAKNLRGRYKLLGQIAISAVLVYLGLKMDVVGLFGEEYQLGWMTIPLSMFWLLGSTNAINLLDGIDGLASSIGMVLCLTLAAINAYFGQFPEAVVMLALAGSLLGFLRYNFAPASIYLGDGGSMVIGLVIGAVALHTQQKSPVLVAMIVPLAVWAVPILDSGAAIVRRRLTGRSIFDPDRGHLHHSLLTRGWSVRQASIFITLICAITCLSAVLGVYWRSEWIVLATVAFVIMFLIGSKTFGHVEMELLRHRIRQHGLALTSGKESGDVAQHGTVRLQGSHEWEVLWDSLVESAPGYGLTKLRLTIHIPAVHEAFYANWRAPKNTIAPAESVWRVAHPLLIDGESVGKLEVAGVADDPSRSTLMQVTQVLDFLEPIEDNIRRVKEHLARGEQPAAKPAGTQPTVNQIPGQNNSESWHDGASLMKAGQD